MNKFSTLIKREFWEHKNSILITPLSIFVLITLFNLFGFVSIGVDDLDIEAKGMQYKQSFSALIHLFASLEPEQLKIALQGVNFTFAMLFNGVLVVILLLYTFSALYDERKDRSILFWKSMPVDDRLTVISKVFIALVVLPLSYLFFTVLTQVTWSIIASVVAWFNDVDAGRVIWQPTELGALVLNETVSYFVNSLWAFPVIAWGLLASSIAKRAPFLYAFLPVVVITTVESSIFHSVHFITWVKERFVGMMVFSGSSQGKQIEMIDFMGEVSLTDVSASISKISTTDMAVGIVLSLVFVAIAVKLRQINDDAY